MSFPSRLLSNPMTFQQKNTHIHKNNGPKGKHIWNFNIEVHMNFEHTQGKEDEKDERNRGWEGWEKQNNFWRWEVSEWKESWRRRETWNSSVLGMRPGEIRILKKIIDFMGLCAELEELFLSFSIFFYPRYPGQ